MISNWVHLNKMHPYVLRRAGALLSRRRAGHAGRAGLGLEHGAEGLSCACTLPPRTKGQMQPGTESRAWGPGAILSLYVVLID